MNFELLAIPDRLLENLPLVWTFFLLMVRFTGLLMFLPGIGMGLMGLIVRFPAILVLAFAALGSSPIAPLPASATIMLLQFVTEVMFGMIIGMVPLLVVAGVQMAGQIGGTTMGLQASQLIDPSMNTSLPDTARIFGDLVVVLFLVLGGHHVAIHAAAGLGGVILPGSFLPAEASFGLMVDRTADVFRMGVVLSAPVVIALLMANFVMGLISKVVPTVNIFIVSFPLTIGIGLILSIIVLPELFQVVAHEFYGIDGALLPLLQDVQQIVP